MREAPPVPVGVQSAGGTQPHRVVVGVDRTGTERAQVVIRRDHRPPLKERLRHSGRPRRHPLRNEAVDGRGAWRHRGPPRRMPPRHHGGGRHRGREGRAPRQSGARRARRALRARRARSSSRRPPTSSARRRQRASWSAKGAPGVLAGRVAAQAMRAPRPECTAVSYMWRRMSAPRLEKAAEQLGPDTGHFGRAARPAGPPHAKRRGQPGPQMGLVDRCRGRTMRGDPPPVTGTPAPVGAMDEVRHHDVAVDVRVAVPAHAVREHGRDGPAGGQHRPGGTRSAGWP